MATTPIYGLPYQSVTDPPHGPNLGANLSLGVEDELVRIDADVTAVEAAIWQRLVAYKTANEDVTSSTAFQDDNHLFVTPTINAVYDGRLVLFAVGKSAADIKFQFTYPAGATMAWAHMVPQSTSSAGTTPPETTVRFDGSSGFVASPAAGIFGLHESGGGTNLGVMGIFEFVLSMGPTAGTLQLQWAQNTSNGVASTLRAGSKLILERIT